MYNNGIATNTKPRKQFSLLYDRDLRKSCHSMSLLRHTRQNYVKVVYLKKFMLSAFETQHEQPLYSFT